MFENDGRNGAATLAVTSGKGGVGKTSLATNLAIALQRRGHRVCLLDGDMGLANVNILLGLQPTHSLDDLKAGRAGLRDLVMRGPEGMDILPAAAGLERLAGESPQDDPTLSSVLAQLESSYDYLLVDTPAGIGETTRAFIEPCDLAALVITPEPTSLTDGFTLLRAMLREEYAGEIAVIVNMVPGGQEGERLFERFEAAARRYLDLELRYLGEVPMDPVVTSAVVNQKPLLVSAPESPSARSLDTLAAQILRVLPAGGGHGSFRAAWTPDPDAPPDLDETMTDAAERDENRGPEPDGERPGAEVPEVVTGPEGFATSASWTLEELAELAESLLGSPEVGESAARRFFGRLERRFTERFRRRVGDIKTLVYESLLQDHLDEEQLREIRDVLVESYARRFGHEDLTAPPAEPAPSTTPAPDTDAVEAVEARIAALYGSEDLDEARSRQLMALLRAYHAERFGTGEHDEQRENQGELDALRARFEAQRRELDARLTEACLLIEEHARLLSRREDNDGDDSSGDTGNPRG